MPALDELLEEAGAAPRLLLVCDTHTEPFARFLMGGWELPLCVIKAGEERKGWAALEAILRKAHEAGLGRDGLFMGIGGGVVCDLTAFAASVYMRGAELCLLPTTLLAMADAAVGGKTGFDLFGIKNLAGTFFPARYIAMPLKTLASLPPREWKSGFAELIKTAVLDTEGDTFSRIKKSAEGFLNNSIVRENPEDLLFLVSRAVAVKGGIVEADPKETGTRRALLNLGHTFGHALEAAAGLGKISHGEAVAWGIVRACELGLALNITPRERAGEICGLIRSCAYEISSPHPLMRNKQFFLDALGGDKKKKAGKAVFVVPAEQGAELITLDKDEPLVESIINGEFVFD
jgi:3-dehydroquinate synthase